ncbi:MAG TPA: fused MFS/spermidine synthase, partial [Polyangiaceae bacterium]|nr:fused MFS/spermidine synthase [Polyangiaceae bacterium]
KATRRLPGVAVAIFLGAFLLFQVQPMAGRQILPWFGGGPAVWTTCLLFFQVLLLVGYTYAHLLSRLTLTRQAAVHLGVALASLAFLPIIPSESWKVGGAEDPSLRILLLLGATLGTPYLLLSTTSPLLQSWVAKSGAASPYRLYAVSNFGSLLGLISYPFVLEPALGVRAQAYVWSSAYAVFALVLGALAIRILRAAPAAAAQASSRAAAANAPVADSPSPTPGATVTGGDGGSNSAVAAPSSTLALLWLLLAACGSLLLMATTSQLTEDVAPIPFLWVLPLTLYMLTFIICFDRERWYVRKLWIPVLILGLLACVTTLRLPAAPLWFQIPSYSLGLFSCCMVCHGELVRLKPDPKHITWFYLVISLGGALGGLFATLVAPQLFLNYWEYHLSLFATVVLLAVSVLRGPLESKRPVVVGCFVVGLAVLGYELMGNIRGHQENRLVAARNFYGALSIYDVGAGTERHVRTLFHGTVPHGREVRSAGLLGRPVGYYSEDSGAALAFRFHPNRTRAGAPAPLHVGVVGMGVAALGGLTRAGDSMVMYEINTNIVDLAKEYFTFRDSMAGKESVMLGDARISMERELKDGKPQHFDLLFLDAFSSDAVPVHLLTREAFAIYDQHLKPDGLMAIQITAQHLDLSRVVLGQAQASGKKTMRFRTQDDRKKFTHWSDWIVITTNEAFLNHPEVRAREYRPKAPPAPVVTWTDDFNNLFRVLR